MKCLRVLPDFAPELFVSAFGGALMAHCIFAAALSVGCKSVPAPPPAPSVSPLADGVVLRAVCVGLNRVDPARWGGWSGYLSDCEFDAEFWAETWTRAGYATELLLTERATVENCRAALERAVSWMKAGDRLVVTVSGHGGQRADAQGEGADGLGEYLCLYDARLEDNVVNRWLRAVPAGVRVLWIADTCHSGTMFRDAKPVRFRRAAIPAQFAGELVLLAGCSEDAKALSTGSGGLWSNALQATGPAGVSPAGWFVAATARVPARQQIPVYAEYGRVSAAFRNGAIVQKAKGIP